MTSGSPVVLERTFDAAPEKVWQALTDAGQMKHWYFDIKEFRPEPGFEFQFYGEGSKGEKYLHRCKVLEAIPQKKLSHSWRYEGYEGSSIITWQLFGVDGKTRLTLAHEGLESFSHNGPDFAKSNFVDGWTYFMDKALKEFLAR